MKAIDTKNELDGFGKKIVEKIIPPHSSRKKIVVGDTDIFTFRRHGTDYFTIDGVKLRTGYRHVEQLYLLPVRELSDNGADWIIKHYRGSSNAYIKVQIIKDDKFFRIKIRNSNSDNKPVFEDLEPIFVYDMRYGSKQDVHVISRGMLGDALKQILSLGYVLIHLYDDGKSFEDKQWDYPLIIRHNYQEHKVYLHVDKDNSTGHVTVKKTDESQLSEDNRIRDTEIEVTLPNIGLFVPKFSLERFCQKYTIFTTDISFEFSITDNSTDPQRYEDESSTTTPFQRTTKLAFPAVHPISSERWTNSNSAKAYMPDEFTRKFTNNYNKSKDTVYDILSTFREGSNMPKTPETSVTIEELMLDPDKYKKIERWYWQLRKTFGSSNNNKKEKISLPYATKNRKDALISRLSRLYQIEDYSTDNGTSDDYYIRRQMPVYRILHGFCNDDIVRKVWKEGNDNKKEFTYEKGKGLRHFPFAFEILAAPLKNPLQSQTVFIGAINYSVSPLDNTFEGDYRWFDMNIGEDIDNYWVSAKDIFEVLQKYGFHKHYGSKSKIPCVIAANLIAPRRDPHGYDKSRIDMQPFAEVIAQAIKKVAGEIPTFRAVGYHFTDESDYKTGRWRNVEKKTSVKDLLKDFLVEERGLPR